MELAAVGAWVIGTRYVFGVYARDAANAGRKDTADYFAVTGQMWTVAWPIVVVTVLWVFALRTASSIPVLTIIVLCAGIFVISTASVISAWAFTFVVTDGTEAKMARARVLGELADRRVVLRAAAVAVVTAGVWYATAYVLQTALAAMGGAALS